jgi:hypothetical protein
MHAALTASELEFTANEKMTMSVKKAYHII